MTTYTETLGHEPIPFNALLSSQPPGIQELQELFDAANNIERSPGAHLSPDILRDDDGNVMDQIVTWLETNMVMLIYFAIGEMEREKSPAHCLSMAHTCWGLLLSRGEELLKGADPTFPLPQFAKAIGDKEPESCEPFPEPTATPDTPDNGIAE